MTARWNWERCESVSGAQEQPAMHIETEVKLDFKVRARRVGGWAGARRARCTMPCAPCLAVGSRVKTRAALSRDPWIALLTATATLQDVIIRPKRSTLKSRSEVSLERTFTFKNRLCERDTRRKLICMGHGR